MSNKTGFTIQIRSEIGALHQVTGVIARHEGNITLVEIVDRQPEIELTYLEVELPGDIEALRAEIEALPVVQSLESVKTLLQIYGKRIIIMGGGAQVGQVAIGAIDRGRPSSASESNWAYVDGHVVPDRFERVFTSAAANQFDPDLH